MIEPAVETTPRQRRLEIQRFVRQAKGFPVGRSTDGLRALLPRGLSPTQYLERATKLSSMGRFQIYDWLYYRWEFWKVSALRARNVLGLFSGLAPSCHACLWPP